MLKFDYIKSRIQYENCYFANANANANVTKTIYIYI